MKNKIILFIYIIFFGIFNGVIATCLQMSFSWRELSAFIIGCLGWIGSLIFIIIYINKIDIKNKNAKTHNKI